MDAKWKSLGLKWVGLLLLGVGLAKGLQLSNWMSEPVKLIYVAPAGDLSVSIRDSANQELRRAIFVRGIREHMLNLQPGAYQLRLRLADGETRSSLINVHSEKTVYRINWSDSKVMFD